MIKTINVLIYLFITLCVLGCSMVRESKTNDLYQNLAVEAEEIDINQNIVINPTLYYLNTTEDKLDSEIRTINVTNYDLREEYAIAALLENPNSPELMALPSGLTLEKIETLPDIINVYLNSANAITPDDFITLKFAIAATLSDFTNKKYVNVFINDKQLPYLNNLPTGVFQKAINAVAEERISLIDKSIANNPELYATLYFLDTSEKYLLPEVRRLVFQDTEYVKTLFNQLISGPEDSYDHKSSLNNSIELLNYSIETDDDTGRSILILNLSGNPQIKSEKITDEEGNDLAKAAITYTMMDFIPNIDGVKIQTGDNITDGIVYTKKSFGDILGTNLNMYLPSGSSATFLTPVERVVNENISNNLKSVMGELIKGPLNTDSTQSKPAIPGGITLEDINNIYMANNTAVIDFNNSILDKTKNLSREAEFVMIFSIINTFTNFDGIKNVQFLINGERVDYINNGWINIKNPLIKNPGINRYKE